MSIKVMLVDDSIVCRRIFLEVLRGITSIEVATCAHTGELVYQKLKDTKVDLIFLDIFMPDINGIEVLKKIKKDYPDIIIVLISGIATKYSEILVEGLRNGAIGFIQKNISNNFEENIKALKEQIMEQIKTVKSNLASRGRHFNQGPAYMERKTTIGKKTCMVKSPTKKPSIIAIGSSTGGPAALSKIIPAFPKTFSIPIVIAQHMPPFFTLKLAKALDNISHLKVSEGKEGDFIMPGNVYIAPGGKHMVLKKSFNNPNIIKIKIINNPPVNSCKPSIDELFKSVSDCYAKKGILAIVLTGMGNDGMMGVKAMKKNNCFCITQSRKTCIVDGMPGSIISNSLSDLILDVEDIPTDLINWFNNRISLAS